MNSIVFLILRRMRVPLLMLSFAYTVATLGFTLIPGQDDQGNIWYLDFFHAFYFVTFMGTTIGFGEIPYPFTDAQRLWALVFIYVTVATWIYTIGALINLLSSETLRKAFLELRFARQVHAIDEPFYLVCGYGDTGTNLVRSLRRRSIKATVIDVAQDRLDALLLDEFPTYIPGICASAANPDTLVRAGIKHPWCRAVVALSNSNSVNLHIAITAKVMNPDLTVICRSDDKEYESNLESFGTNHIVNPFEVFSHDLALAYRAPNQYLLDKWFRGARDEALIEPVQIPRGNWIICGYGRFGQAVHLAMQGQGINPRVIDQNDLIAELPHNAVIGDATTAAVLNSAGIQDANVIIAGTDDDSNNLSILVTARKINPTLFAIIRQNENANRDLFKHSDAAIVMEPSDVITKKIRTLLTSSMTEDFLRLARAQEDEWAQRLVEQIRSMSSGVMPDIWMDTIGHRDAHAVMNAIREGEKVMIEHLTTDHLDREKSLPMIVLFHQSASSAFLKPKPDTEVHIGDRFLFAGTPSSRHSMQWNLQNEMALTYVRTGTTPPQTLIGRWLANRRTAVADSSMPD